MTQSKQGQSQGYPEQSEYRRSTSRVTVAQSIVIGSVAGGTEVLINHPLWSIKTRLQRGDTFTFKPSLLYRGILPNAASMIPITAMQVGLNRSFQNVFFKHSTDLSDYQRITSAFVAGVGSSAVSCPTEFVMTQQQGQTGGSFYVVGKRLAKQNGWHCLFTGLSATAMREGTFTAFYLAGTPILKAKIQPYCANDYAASLGAGIGAGVGATLASQGVDTLKTIQQAADVSQPVGLKEAAKKLYSTEGVYGFFKGGIPRGGRVVSAVTAMGLVNEKMEAMFRQRNSEDDVSEEKTRGTPAMF